AGSVEGGGRPTKSHRCMRVIGQYPAFAHPSGEGCRAKAADLSAVARSAEVEAAEADRIPDAGPDDTCYTPRQSRRGIAIRPESISDLQKRLASQHYVADRGLAVSLFLPLRLKRPLFLEGEAGVGKTSLASAAAAALETDLIRLQCYEGLDVGHALYEWDYSRQLLELRILDATHTLNRESARRELYSDAFLIKRPLLQAIDPLRTRPAVLLIDEIDRADQEFEGFLLELLAEFQITIPELGTVRATV